MIYDNSFEIILDHSIYVSKSTRRMRGNREQREASVFLEKNTLSAYTLYNIFNPKTVNVLPSLTKGAVVFDFSSANTIARSMFEAYINMHYLLLEQISNDEREFRLDRWEKHALTERKLIADTLESKDPKLQIEQAEIEAFEKSMYCSKYFLDLPPNKQQSIKNSFKWSSEDTLSRADIAGIDRSQSEFLYKIFSNYSHSESFSIMQLHSIDHPLEARELCKPAVKFGEMYLALTLDGFGKVDKKVSELINENEKVIELIKFWTEFKSKKLVELNRK